MIDYDRLRTVADQLERYAELEDTELGELNTALIRLSHYTDYMREEFAHAVLAEMEDQLQVFQEGATIVKREETFTQTVTYLEWE